MFSLLWTQPSKKLFYKTKASEQKREMGVGGKKKEGREARLHFTDK